VLTQPAIFGVSDARDIGEVHIGAALQRCEQFLERLFAFPENDKLCAGFEILLRISAWLGASDDRLPSSLARNREKLDDVRAGHQVRVKAKNRRRAGLQSRDQRFASGKGGVEDFNIEALGLQMRTQIKNAERRVGLHDLKLLRVLVEEVTVCEQKV